VAVGQGPWHSVNSDIYHDNPDCQTGGSIDPENIRKGTSGKRLCEECARLDNAAGSVAPPMGDLTGELGRGTREREEDLSTRERRRSRLRSARQPGRHIGYVRNRQVPLAIHTALHSGAARWGSPRGFGHLGDLRRSRRKGRGEAGGHLSRTGSRRLAGLRG
jgi:hypothetical protein